MRSNSALHPTRVTIPCVTRNAALRDLVAESAVNLVALPSPIWLDSLRGLLEPGASPS